MANKETNYKRYAIVVGTEEDGSRTLEDYTSLEDAMKAYEFIKKNGYHLTENDGDKVEFENSPRIDFNIDAELWNESGAHKGFESIEGVSPFSFVDFNSKDKTWILEEIKNEKHFSIHEVSKNTFVKSKEFDSYLEAEDEFERINKEYDVSNATKFITSTSDSLEGFPNNKKALDSAIPLEEYEEVQKADQFNYMMLGRLKQDCDYFLGNGNGHEKHLWADNVEDQIKEMGKLHDTVRFKPDYLTKEDIQKYKTDMCKLKLEQEKDNPDFITEKNLPFYYGAMSGEDFNKYGAITRKVFGERYKEVSKHFKDIDFLRDNGDGFDYDALHYSGEVFEYDVPFGDTFIKADSYKSISFFGIKDTLKPINEYIAEIKNSPEFQAYKASADKEQRHDAIYAALSHADAKELSCGDIWVNFETKKYPDGIFAQFESKELDDGSYSDEIISVFGYKNSLKDGEIVTDYSQAEFLFDTNKNEIFSLELYMKIQNNEVVPPSEYTKIDLESEAFKSLDSEVQATITDYINEQSDKIVNAALEEEKLKQEQSKNTDLEPF